MIDQQGSLNQLPNEIKPAFQELKVIKHLRDAGFKCRRSLPLTEAERRLFVYGDGCILELLQADFKHFLYRPQGRGKAERLFQFVDSSFRPEVQALVDRGEVATLEELNASLRSWLDGYYHTREHGSTKQSPQKRFEASGKPRKRLPLVDLNDMFLWEEERTANKTGCIQLAGNTYEVDSDLASKRLALRYDPLISAKCRCGKGRDATTTPYR